MPRRGTRNKLLRDMRKVYDRPANEPGESEAMKMLRELFKKDPDRFLDRITKLESSHRAGQAKVSVGKQEAAEAPPVPARDEGAENALETVEHLLDSFEEGLAEAERVGQRLLRVWHELTDGQRQQVRQIVEAS